MRRIYFDNSHGYESLAESIVLQAVKDYTRSYRAVLRNPENKKAAAMMKEIPRPSTILTQQAMKGDCALLVRSMTLGSRSARAKA